MTAVPITSSYAYRRSLTPRQRALAWCAVAGAHALAAAGLVLARPEDAPPPQPTIMVSLIQAAVPSEAQPEPPPPQPEAPPPTPAPQMVASPRPTASPMTAPPLPEPPRPAAPQPAAPQPAAAASTPAPAAPSTTPPNFTAAYLNNPGPQYPYESRRKREQGTVRLKVYVNAEGRPEQVQIDRSSGFPNLDNAALDVVKKRWRFVPAKQDGKAVAAWVVVPMEFELKDR